MLQRHPEPAVPHELGVLKSPSPRHALPHRRPSLRKPLCHVRKPSTSGVSAGDDYPQPAPLYCRMHGVAWHPIAGAPSQLRHSCMIVLPVRDLTKIKTQKSDLKKVTAQKFAPPLGHPQLARRAAALSTWQPTTRTPSHLSDPATRMSTSPTPSRAPGRPCFTHFPVANLSAVHFFAAFTQRRLSGPLHRFPLHGDSLIRRSTIIPG